jgi:hypothetical protein
MGPACVPAAYHGHSGIVFTKNATIIVLLQKNQYFVTNTYNNKAPPSQTPPPQFALAPSPVRKIAHLWHANKNEGVQVHASSSCSMVAAMLALV